MNIKQETRNVLLNQILVAHWDRFIVCYSPRPTCGSHRPLSPRGWSSRRHHHLSVYLLAWCANLSDSSPATALSIWGQKLRVSERLWVYACILVNEVAHTALCQIRGSRIQLGGLCSSPNFDLNRRPPFSGCKPSRRFPGGTCRVFTLCFLAFARWSCRIPAFMNLHKLTWI